MAVVDLPVIEEAVSLSSAFDMLKSSGKSGLVVGHPDGPRLYHAESLDLQLHTSASSPMRDVRGGCWLPQASSDATALALGCDHGALLALDAGMATLGGLSDDSVRSLSVAVRVYHCNRFPLAHTYTPMEYRSLPIVNGVRHCLANDKGIVS